MRTLVKPVKQSINWVFTENNDKEKWERSIGEDVTPDIVSVSYFYLYTVTSIFKLYNSLHYPTLLFTEFWIIILE